ncbi:MAG: hypothetical protein VX516_03520, partial [Actinomycetota bacterium]|nr:hypothetical protein [Actinomycetota bacterium]
MIARMQARFAEGAKRDGKPSKVDQQASTAAILEDIAAKVDAGELTRAEAGEMIAGLEARIAEHAKGADRDGKPSKADMDARKAAFLDGLDAKVDGGELTRAEADEMIARMQARFAEHAKGADRDGKPSKADMEARKAAFLEDLDAKVDAGELTRAEADEMIARMQARFAEGAKRDGKPSKADLEARKAV